MKVKPKNNRKSRKEVRKENRRAKKAKKHEFYMKRKERNRDKKPAGIIKVGNPDEAQRHNFTKKGGKLSVKNKPSSPVASRKRLKEKVEENSNLQDEFRQELVENERRRKELHKQIQTERVKKLKEDNEAEDREIRKLENKLKLKKRSDKSITNFFAQDGLDYLLEVCDPSKLRDVVEAEKNFKHDDSDFDNDYEQIFGKTPGKKVMSTKESSVGSDEDDIPDEISSKRSANPSDKYSNVKKLPEDSDSDVSTESEELSTSKSKKKIKKEKAKNSGQPNSSNYVDETDEDDKDLSVSDATDSLEDSESSEPESEDVPISVQKRKREIDVKEGTKKMKADERSKSLRTGKQNKPMEVEQTKKKSKKPDDLIENPFSDDEVSSLGSGSEGEEEEDVEDGGLWEDIYGRTRDKEGNVVPAYQPPHLRKETKAKDAVVNSEKMMRLKKQLKGLLNRLAENNIASISSQVESLYMSHSRNEMNETLWCLLEESIVSETLTPERLIAEHGMLIAVLGANVGGEVSAHCLQRCVTAWHRMWHDGPSIGDKRTNNLLLLLSYMYHFKLFHCTLLFDILELLVKSVEEKEVELVLQVLRTVGFTLRKDDPSRLKEFVLRVQTLANAAPSAGDGTRARFMLETVLAIKNNNMNKIPNYNPEYGEHIKKILRACIRKGNYNAELKITLEDLLKADERGRWWVVGSAWTGELPGEKEGRAVVKDVGVSKMEEGFSNHLLELAKKQRMNTDARRTIFCIIMSAEDFLDAFEKLLKLGLKGPSEREILNVLIHCLLHEKQYNPYYAYLARRFCQFDRRFQVMLQFAVWDRIQDLKSLSPTNVTNLAKFLAFLLLEKSLAISVLKVLHFAELDKHSVRFIRQVLLGVLLADSEDVVLAVFNRISGSKPLKLFREGLRLFLHHFVLKNSKAVQGADIALLTKRIQQADSVLSASTSSLAF